MSTEKVLKEMNDQIQRELDSAYIYLSMAAYFDGLNMPGFAHWMKKQFEEEQEHAMKFYDFIYDRGGEVKLQPLTQPPVEFDSPLAAFEITLAHEKKITGHINDLYALAVAEKDYASQVLLQWFIEEQVEEEKNAGDILDLLKKASGHFQALHMLDRELGQR